ncbi:hypothetical protein KY290_033579 [Solanum tuberosum]|uniref:CCHC-type domain-containing protein n=1 Tax=Solanum tuberosum TaxID=4113 RepID=A0ABQ7U2E6_SOLTU|nr:hypothetical protein KY290_033579 [Solanum tuberosum]
MAEELPADRFRPPDPATLMPKHNIHSPLLESSSESSYNSSQVREEAIHTAMAGKELDGTRTNIYMEESRSIGGTKSEDIQDSQKSLDFTVPFARNVQATEARSVGESPQIRHQNRTTGEVIRDESDTGDCSHGRGGSIIGNSSTFHGEIAGRAPGDFTETPVKNFPNLKQAEELQLLAKTQNQYREGKKQVQEFGHSITSHMDDQNIKNQSRDTCIPNAKSHNTAIPIAPLNPGNELNRKEIIKGKFGLLKNMAKSMILLLEGSNFDKQVPTANTNNARSDHPLVNSPNPHKTDPLAAPAPYTVVQTYADRLRYNQDKCDTPINLTTPEITTKQGLPVVLYVKDEVMKDLAAACKYTLTGKFSYTMPKVELIRNNFILQTQLSSGVKIAHFNSRHVYIDLDNELDYNMVWTKQRMSIAGQVMRIQVWTPNFKHAEETPIVPIWISLPELPWHCYNKEFLAGLLSPIGKVLYLDSASIKKTRGSQASVKVQVDLTQKRPPYIWMDYIGEDITDGRWQKIEYDNISDYCFYCKHQGHLENDCTIKQRDEDKKKKEMEAESSPSLEVLDKYKDNTSDSRPQTAAIKQQGQAEYKRKPTTTGQDNTNQQLQVDIIATQVTESTSRKEVSIRKAGTDTGKQLEEHDDKQVNNGNKVKVPPDDYGALNSKDEIDPDNQSME